MGLNRAMHWLLVEGLLPLFGAAALFLLWGAVRYVSHNGGPFSFSWREAIDPIGWLYVAVLLSAQSAVVAASFNELMAYLCGACAGVSTLLLLAAMTNKGQTPNWKPPSSFVAVAIVMVFAILVAGYQVHKEDRSGRARSTASEGGGELGRQ